MFISKNFMKKRNITKTLQCLILLATISGLFLTAGNRSFVTSVAASNYQIDPIAMKKMSVAVQKVLTGEITLNSEWCEYNDIEPFVQVIIQTNTANTGALRADIQNVGGIVWTNFYAIKGVEAWVPIKKLTRIALRSDVERVSPNF
jgi:hypothetical protein